ncbi:MAG: hypothetical protein J6W04_01570 [Bacteroidales bacterium]|nr:hypothetical protein [Bacteroidales bacterium]
MAKWIELSESETELKIAVNVDNIACVGKHYVEKWADDGMERVERTRIYYKGSRYMDVMETYTQVKQMIMG